MHPEFQFSPNLGPAWTPPVWAQGPDALVAQAKSQLFIDQQDITSVLNGGDRAMDGNSTAPQNESDQTFDVKMAGARQRDGSRNDDRLSQWQDSVRDLYRTAPLAAWADGMHDGPANPNA